MQQLWFVLAVWASWNRILCGAQVHGLTCQLATIAGHTLQEQLGIECNTSEAGEPCQCPDPWFASSDNVWAPVTDEIGQAMDLGQAGYWFILDDKAECVLSPEGNPVPVPLPCPPGFFCEGKRRAPISCYTGDHCPSMTGPGDHRCPKGFFCPIPSLPPQECPDGFKCRQGAFRPDPCPPGSYCNGGQIRTCPSGSFCPFASENHQKCNFLAVCPAGSKSENLLPVLLGVLVLIGLVLYLAARNYEFLRDKPGWINVVIACAVVGGSWCLDRFLAGFLTFFLAAIVINWILLRCVTCPGIISKLMLLITLAAVAAVLWIANPAWSVFIVGLVFFAIILHFMAHENCCMVYLGRLLMLFTFVVLSSVTYALDPAFAMLFVVVVVVAAIVVIVSFCVESRRQRKQTPLRTPLSMRLGLHQPDKEAANPSVKADAADSLSAPLQAGFSDAAMLSAAGMPAAATEQLALGDGTGDGTVQPGDAPVPNAIESQSPSTSAPMPNGISLMEPQASVLSSSDRRTGVNFRLERVNFDLHDGNRLLNNLTLKIEPGCRAAVMGPSGSGKSTLLAVLSGRASYGEVTGKLLCSGYKIDDSRFLRGVTGFVPQDDVLNGELTCEENIAFQAMLRLPNGTQSAEVRMQIERVGKDLNLTEIMKARVGTPEKRGVSGGQRKRVSIGMELVSQPLLLFADEPTSGLDSTTSHEVIRCMNGAAARLGTTVVSVIHQPRYETLLLFDDLVLLGAGGWLVYAGHTSRAVEHFRRHLDVQFKPETNPADVMMDAIQPPLSTPQACADAWNRSTASVLDMEDKTPRNSRAFMRATPPFFQSMLIFMDRSILQSLRSTNVLLVNQLLCLVSVFIICEILKYEHLDQYFMQSAFASLFLMLLQGVAAQRVYGDDLQVTLREAKVGTPTIAYFFAKDLASFFEITLSAASYTAAYGTFSGAHIPIVNLFVSTWAFIYSVFGFSYSFSILLSPSAAQMCAVVMSFIAFCVAGVYQPPLPQIVAMFGGRGWMVPALSPIRWFWAYLLTFEVQSLTPTSRELVKGALKEKGYDIAFLDDCKLSYLGDAGEDIFTLEQAWSSNHSWVCSVAHMLMLGILFRFVAAICLMLFVTASTSGWARFFASSDRGLWNFVGRFFLLIVACFLLLFLCAEVWLFGVLKLTDADGNLFGWLSDQ